MNKKIVILTVAVVLLIIVAWSPWITNAYSKKVVLEKFTAKWQGVSDGCGFNCDGCGIGESRRTLFGVNVKIEYACGMLPEDSAKYNQKSTIFVSSLGTAYEFKQSQSDQKKEDDQPVQENNNNYETLNISLGEEFTLHKNQSAIINESGLAIKITEFYNSPCPKGVQCIWSGVGIAFAYSYGGEVQKGIDLVQAFGYKTNIIDTDNETYAKLKITKIE
ncbi:MAG: hypothetical protein Q7K65_03205 [Candidatus Buchananbacteria bacterium]|nr:hypothetical protein [Candidatus Buchananbacteria bacterium]